MLTALRKCLRLPPSYEYLLGGDTGTYCSIVLIAASDDPAPHVLVLEEFPNYRYVAGELELLGVSMAEWGSTVVSTVAAYTGDDTCRVWADPNTQFRAEFRHYGIHLLPNTNGLELRTEVTRGYFQTGQIFLAPWLDVLPYELEQARWPPQETAAGTFRRLKTKDHTLDGLEHALSRKPRGRPHRPAPRPSFLEQMFAAHRRADTVRGDSHLGRG